MSSIDAILSAQSKHLKPGETITFTLVKKANELSRAPKIAEKRDQPEQAFPQLLKFSSTVAPPDFQNLCSTMRIYEQDRPKAMEDEEEEEERKKTNFFAQKRKRRPPRHNNMRQWIIHDVHPNDAAEVSSSKYNLRYEGCNEANASQYILLSVPDEEEIRKQNTINNNGNNHILHLQKVNGWLNFTQPYKTQTLKNLSEAERKLQNRKTQYLKLQRTLNQPGVDTSKVKGASKMRLMEKLGGEMDEEDDDIMADVAFHNASSSGGASGLSAKAKRELLGIENGDDDAVERNGAKKRSAGTAKDDFYELNIEEAFENVDYDANEQFDDDDVQPGEEGVEQLSDDGGFADEEDGVGDDDDDEDDDGNDGESTAKKGLATAAGLKEFITKKEEIPAVASASAGTASAGVDLTKKAAISALSDTGGMSSDGGGGAKSSDEDQMAARQTKRRKFEEKVHPESAASDEAVSESRFDKDGLRVISLKAVQKEIWLNQGQIKTKQLFKIFSVPTKKSKLTDTEQERLKRFKEIVNELCTIKKDNIKGKLLALKQHYAKA